MKKLDKIIKELYDLEITENIYNDIIETFEDYTFKGISEIIFKENIKKDEITFYINHRNSWEINIKIENNMIKEIYLEV